LNTACLRWNQPFYICFDFAGLASTEQRILPLNFSFKIRLLVTSPPAVKQINYLIL
jgi:hypothetical protein